MIRIDIVEPPPPPVVLLVQGELHLPELEILETELRRWLAPGGRVVVDLTGVPTVNWIGLERLQQWVEEPRTGGRLTLRCAARSLRNLLRARGVAIEDDGPENP